MDEPGCQACDNDPKTQCVADKQTQEGQQCYQCIERPEDCRNLGLLDEESCRQCNQNLDTHCELGSKTKEGKSCYVCNKKTQACAALGLLSSLECKYKCTQCVEDQKADSGEPCFRCETKQASADCLNENYLQDCSGCQETEICSETNVILFYPTKDKTILSCYTCIPAR